MAFPGTLNIDYYKGDTYEFKVYPKKADGTAFMLTDFATTTGYDISGTTLFENAGFYFSTQRGSAGLADRHQCFAKISNDGTHVLCTIRPDDSESMIPGTQYVYDVEIKKEASAETNNYPLVHTLLTGTITVTDQVTGAV